METRHDKWSYESGISLGSPVETHHMVTSIAFKIAATIDGLNLKNVACFELLARRLQLEEEVVGRNPGNPDFSHMEHFLGIEQRRGGSYLVPSLKKHVADELARENAIAKERRKVLESLAEAAAQPPKRRGGRGPP